MTDKEKTIKELKEALDSLDITNKYRLNLIRAIEYLQKESVSEGLEEASKEWLAPQLDKSYANYGEGKMMELTHFDGYAMLDAIEFGAQWQKEQMIPKAIEGEVITTSDYGWENIRVHKKEHHCGQKVKVIVIKED